jgi:Ferritin-like domain
VNRRHLILTAAGAGLAVTGLTAPARGLAAPVATDDELAYANFGHATEFLLKDFYKRATAAKLSYGMGARNLSRGALNADEHATALAKLLVDAGQTAATEEDFEFAWPRSTFAATESAAKAGLTITQALLGSYIGAAASISIPSYRTLYASMAANLAQQVAALSALAGGRAVGVSFPAAFDVETASDAIEAYLG